MYGTYCIAQKLKYKSIYNYIEGIQILLKYLVCNNTPNSFRTGRDANSKE